MNTQLLIIEPGKPIHFVLFALAIFLIWLLTRLLKNVNDKPKQAVFITICLLTIVGFFAYKYALSHDTEYDFITRDIGGFDWWKELPLHLCNINMILIPISLLTKNRSMMSFCFFVAPLGALMSLLMPSLGFSGYSILLPRMLGYYSIHFLIMIEALSLYTLGYYAPEYRDIPLALVTTFLVALVVFGINLTLKFAGICPDVNYFFLMYTEENPILEFFYSYIPYPFLYALPCAVILLVYMLLITLITKLIRNDNSSVRKS